MVKEEKHSYVKLENANLIKMNIDKLLRDFAKYSNIIIKIKELSDKKLEKREEFLERLKLVKNEFERLISTLPEAPEKIRKLEKKEKIEIKGKIETLSELREEFERLRKRLEEIKKGV